MAVDAVSGCGSQQVVIVDLGCGEGTDLLNVATALAPRDVALSGVDASGVALQAAEEAGISTCALDIEHQPLPYASGSVDIVIANQVLEHTKEIFFITSEVSRVLRPGGSLLVGSPNLASLHSRLMLLLGMQPSPIDVYGPHVRGFTIPGLAEFIEHGGYFNVTQVRGSNFYLVPPRIAAACAERLPSMAVSFFLRCERTTRAGSFAADLHDGGFETRYALGQ